MYSFEFFNCADCAGSVSAFYFLRTKLLKDNPFSEYKAKVKIKEREFLTQEQLDNVIHRQLESQRVEQVRDVFVFCCYTALAYADVKN